MNSQGFREAVVVAGRRQFWKVPAAVVEEAEAAVAAGASQGFPVSMATAPDDVDDDVAHAARTTRTMTIA